MTRVREFAGTAALLGLVLLVVRVFALERDFGLVELAPLVFGGFLVHAWLPERLALPGFLALSAAGFVLVLGGRDAAWVLGLGAALFGLCHTPGPTRLRAGLLLAAAAGLIAWRGWSAAQAPATRVVPVLASLFMFRAIVYLHDRHVEQRTGEPPASLALRLAYFFPLPNACFLLFPVLDYRTFRRTYRARPPGELARRGVEWIWRGVLHLLLYRAVYAHLTPAEDTIQGPWGVAAFLTSSYLLYLRISGHFHLIVGVLHLFGFGLPETNVRYLLASSFSDCWRRINVYWTEFIKKLVYFPVFVRVRARGLTNALIAAAALSFAATWLLHVYQWFWLQGELPHARDGSFWLLAGVLALGSMLREARGAGSPTRGRLGARRPTLADASRRAVRTLFVFLATCLAWSLWVTPTPSRWFAVLARAGSGSGGEYLTLGALALGIVLAGIAWQCLGGPLWQQVERRHGSGLRAISVAAGAVLALLLAQPRVQDTLGPTVAGALRPVVDDRLNVRDRERLTSSYYDRLVDREGWGGRLRERRGPDGNDPEAFANSPLAKLTGAPLRFEIAPSQSAVFLGALTESNRWGMRDRDYALEKPADTVRIAVLGTCYEVGTGVTNDEVFEALTEERLERELTPHTGQRYEILNFSVPGYTLLHHVTVVREKARRFAPDYVVVSDHARPSVQLLVEIATRDEPWPPGLAEVLRSAGVERGMEAGDVRERLLPTRAGIERWALRNIAEACRATNAVPVLLRGPWLESLRGEVDREAEAQLAEQLAVALELGYEVLDLRDAFEGETYESANLPNLENCPSARGHRRMAAGFFEALAPLLAR